jgi:hypothetical protein
MSFTPRLDRSVHILQVSRGKKKAQNEAASPHNSGERAVPVGGKNGNLHTGLVNLSATEGALSSLLEVFQTRVAEVKEHGHATTEVPIGDIAAVLESIGISCSVAELEALCGQLHHIAGHIGALIDARLVVCFLQT